MHTILKCSKRKRLNTGNSDFNLFSILALEESLSNLAMKTQDQVLTIQKIQVNGVTIKTQVSVLHNVEISSETQRLQLHSYKTQDLVHTVIRIVSEEVARDHRLVYRLHQQEKSVFIIKNI